MSYFGTVRTPCVEIKVPAVSAKSYEDCVPWQQEAVHEDEFLSLEWHRSSLRVSSLHRTALCMLRIQCYELVKEVLVDLSCWDPLKRTGSGLCGADGQDEDSLPIFTDDAPNCLWNSFVQKLDHPE